MGTNRQITKLLIRKYGGGSPSRVKRGHMRCALECETPLVDLKAYIKGQKPIPLHLLRLLRGAPDFEIGGRLDRALDEKEKANLYNQTRQRAHRDRKKAKVDPLS